MISIPLAVLLILLGLIFIFLFVYTVLVKLRSVNLQKRELEKKNKVREAVEHLLGIDEAEFNAGLDEFVTNIPADDGSFLALTDAYLMEALELHGTKSREKNRDKNHDRLIAIAKRLDFPSGCFSQIRSLDAADIALGSRRAGLYKLSEAADDMINALELLSSEDQFEILLGLARIGNAKALQRAFEKISDNIIINERSVIEILGVFPGGKEKKKLFKAMISSDTNYLAVLFLKAISREIAKPLTADIISILHKDNKELRAAAIRGLSTLGKDAPVDELIRSLEDSDWEVRALAAKALSPIKTPEVSYALYNVLGDQQWWVRQNAANALFDHPEYETLFILAAETGDEYTRDSIIAVLENGSNPILLRSIKIMTAE